MIYIAVFVLLFVFSLNKQSNDKLFKIGVIILLAITCCRSKNVGIDTAGGYWSYYNQVMNGGTLPWMEYSWVILNKISIQLGLGYEGVIAISGILTIIPVALVIQKQCDNKCLGLAIYNGLYLVLYSFNLMRQSIAISWVLLAICFYIDKKKKIALFVFIFAVIIHNSALFAFPIIIFIKLNLKYSKVILLLFVSFITGIIINESVFYAISGQYANNLFNDDGYTGFRESVFYPAVMALIFTVFFLYIIHFNSDKIKKDPWLLISLLGIIVMNLTVRLGQGTRIVLYFSQAQLVFIPRYLEKNSTKEIKSTIMILYFLYLAANYFRILLSQWNSLVPYTTFFYHSEVFR